MANSRSDHVIKTIDRALADYSVSPDAMRHTPPVRDRELTEGRLHAVPTGMARDAGLRVPVAITDAAWQDCVAWTSADTQRLGWYQDETGRLWDVLWMTRCALRRARSSRSTLVELLRIRRDAVPGPDGLEPEPALLRVECGPGDRDEPVLTISMPDEG